MTVTNDSPAPRAGRLPVTHEGRTMNLRDFDNNGIGRITFDSSGEWVECWNNGQKVYTQSRTFSTLHSVVHAATEYHLKAFGFLPSIDNEVKNAMDRQDRTRQ